jgi:hypothetical protein
MDVYTALHVEHKKKHIDDEGDLNIYGENIQRMLGIYSTKEAADEAIRRMRSLPGFVDEPDCFAVSVEAVDEVGWTEGFKHD